MYLLVRAADGGVAKALAVLAEPRTADLLVRTMLLAAAVTVSALAIGVGVAWITTRTDLPGRRTWATLTAIPLAIPSYVGAFAVVGALGPKGIVQGWLEPFGVQRLPEVYGFFGAWLTLTLFTYPYALLVTRAAIRNLDPTLEEAARALGHDARETFRRVVIPQLRPSIVAGGLLVALYTIHDFGAVSLMRYESFTQGIYVSYQGSFDRSRAAVLALALVAVTVAVLAAETRFRGRAGYHRTHAGSARAPAVHHLGRLRWPAFAACCVLVVAALGMPVGVIAYWLVRSARDVAFDGLLVQGLHSVQASAAAAAAGVLVAWPVAFLGVRFPGKLTSWVERSTFVGYALPGVVVALALVFVGARLMPALYQTLPMLVFAYVVLFLPQAIGALRASLLQVHPSVEEAAQSLGSGRARTLLRVVLPMVRPGIVSAGALVFLTAMKELPATVLLAPTGYGTLATRIWNATSAARFDSAAPAALMLLGLACVPLALLVLQEDRT